MIKKFTALLLSIILIMGTFSCLSVVVSATEIPTQNQLNIVVRGNYMYNITWVSQATVKGWKDNYTYTKGNTYHLPYGQPISAGKYIGFGVTIDEFLASTQNAESVFYTSKSHYNNNATSVYYASDCSAFVSWAWGISRKTTYYIPDYSTQIGAVTEENLQKLQLGDALNSPSGTGVGHVVLVTGLTYDKNGNIQTVEITEQTPPQMKRTISTVSNVATNYSKYFIQRYIGEVPPAPDGSTDDSAIQTPTVSVYSKYYPACSMACVTLIDGLTYIGVDASKSHRMKIAQANGITDYAYTAQQNTQMLDLLIAGKLINPDYIEPVYYSACDGSFTTLEEALDSYGIEVTTEKLTSIAKINGILDYEGTSEQNDRLLELLKTGKLINPDETETVATIASVSETETHTASLATTNRYFPICDSTYTSIADALKSINVDSSFANRKLIAIANGMLDYSGAPDENIQLLELLKAGKLINPDCVDETETSSVTEPSESTSSTTVTEPSESTVPSSTRIVYYPAYTGPDTTAIVTALDYMKIDSSKSHRMIIAIANGITDYNYTSEQNTYLLKLLKEGKLIDPESSGMEIETSTPTESSKNTDPTENTNATESDIYYKQYTGNDGFVDALNSLGIDSSKEHRAKIALANGLFNYKYTPEQNTYLLNLLKAGKLIKSEVKVDTISKTPVDLGEEFSAFVYNIKAWKLVTRNSENKAVLNQRVGEGSQLLKFKKSADGNYFISQDDLYLTVENASITTGSTVTFTDYTDTPNQKWVIVGEDGKYKFIPANTENVYLEVKDDKTDDGTEIIIDSLSVTQEQLFQIIPYSGNVISNGYTRGYLGGAAGDGKVYAKGIDVSKWNERDQDTPYDDVDFDFKKVKAAGNDFVIIRAGSTNLGKDPMFEKYYEAAKEAGLNVGAYFFSYALDEATVRSDAEKFLSYIEGKTFEYPLYLDFEEENQSTLIDEKSKSLCLTFMTMMANQGYLAGIYTGKSMSMGMNMEDICATYEFWIAHYYDSDGSTYSSEYSTKYGIYQYTSSYKIDSIEGDIDANYCYKDYPAIVKKYGFNGYQSEIEENEPSVPSKPTDSTIPSEPTQPTIKPVAKKPLIKVGKKILKAGEKTTLKVVNIGKNKVQWKSANPKVAEVTKKGVLKALGKGIAKITATVKGYGKYTCRIKVTTKPKIYNGKKVIKNNKAIKVKKGKNLTLKIKGKASGINNNYKTTNKKIAKVTSGKKGAVIKIKGLKKGSAKITVTVNKKYKTTIKVKVV